MDNALLLISSLPASCWRNWPASGAEARWGQVAADGAARLRPYHFHHAFMPHPHLLAAGPAGRPHPP
eukprot:CAMPEP_0202897736 /NCGR_PEP_ID=MMETSP1392-20130828/6429_1 /ASSEMBLY_ACC=CAM_ASM_000868 /TAXON_ID=225041 /ORGANISM="Chlamydomonas chlamydogama, Strain SAG 11-48b" /LENGTH=66 /DNA_ID=CAMNT_0049583465 /DNA_START=631 /DNA_END=828 /DNA_ORIENTATION=+